jgi:signal transduction histidine kinase/CheY-like chemotaxis protein
MIDWLDWLFSSNNFLPHGHCFLWQPGTLWLNVASDGLIAASYFAIPAALYYFVRRRKNEIPYVWVPLMFAAFIMLCGTTHVMEIVTVWSPLYRAAGALKLLTGLVSFATVVTLVRIMPHAMLLKTPGQLHAEVAARTAQLAAVNIQLQEEVAARAAVQQELQLADRRKDEFLATLAHELRNPLAPIRQSLRILNAAEVDIQKREWSTQVISRQVGRMALLLDDLMDISRITRHRLTLKVEPVDVAFLITTAVETAAPGIENKHHTLTINLPHTPVTAKVDSLRISQAVANLLSNAAKYTPPGGHIELTVRAESAGLTIIVTDTGIGFEPSALADMFEIFTRGAPSSETEPGLGLGLALVRQLVTLHGGTVEAQSTGIGKGSEFKIHIPDAVVMNIESNLVPVSIASASRTPPHGKVVVVDDNRDSADALGLVLEMQGYEVMVGYSGHDALRLAQHLKPEAVILDIGMPDLTGYEVARRLRGEHWGREIFLVAMTGWGQARDKEFAREAGFDQHFTKPLDPDDLNRQLAAFFDDRAAPI